MKRNEIVAARMAETEFLDEAVHMIYLLNRRYKPFYKWFHRRLKELPILGEKTYMNDRKSCEISLMMWIKNRNNRRNM